MIVYLSTPFFQDAILQIICIVMDRLFAKGKINGVEGISHEVFRDALIQDDEGY